MTRHLFMALLALVAIVSSPASARPGDEHGPFWLDESYSPRTLEWVSHQRDRTLGVLRTDSHFATFEAASGEILTDPSRPPDPVFNGEDVFEYRQDRDRPFGIWRRSSKATWLAGKPAWETLIDLDSLSAGDGRKWIFAGAACRKQRCLVRLSDNGKDSAVTREFDLDTKSFVAGGFALPEGKGRAWWYDDDTLLVSPVLGKDSVNSSLLPRTLRVWKRGTPLGAAETIFATTANDVGLSVALIKAGGADAFLVARHTDYQTREYHLMSLDGVSRPVALPALANILGTHDGKLLLRPNVDWTPPGAPNAFPAGAVIGVSLDALMKDARIADAELLYLPEGDDGVRSVISTSGRLFVELTHDYRSRIVEISRGNGHSISHVLPLPSDRFLTSLGFHDGLLLLREEAPLMPPRTVLADPATGVERLLYAQAPQFDDSRLTSEIWHTASRDGTPLAYTITYPRGMAFDGSHPTLVYGYGGYDVAITARYEPLFCKLWMERGGVYVHAYLRGGGEHGPAWHRVAMRGNRQRPYDDMAAIVRDLQRRGVTSPKHTGIIGRSNGGLMAAVVMEQIPDLLNAVVIGGPLIDMLNYPELPPGGTWVAEYGDPRDPKMQPVLRSYSPMQNIAGPEVTYPKPLVITATYDDRVLPGHARRFASQLASKGHDSFYFEDRQGGHYWELSGGPPPGDWRARAIARAVEFTYLWQQLGDAVGR